VCAAAGCRNGVGALSGPPPQPTALRVLRGNPGKRAINTDEPKAAPLDGPLRPPTWLPAGARRHWRRVVPYLQSLKVLTEADMDAAAAMAQELATYAEMQRVLAKEGRVYQAVTKTGVIRMPHPAVHIANAAFANFVKLTDRFGMNPAYRSKLKVEAEREIDPLEALRKRERNG
ncbi:MAG: phage terminase small subunit P27 family, partial [Burkholderiaceae bacterium]